MDAKNLLTEKDLRILHIVELVYRQGGMLIRDLCIELKMIKKTLKADVERANLLFFPINLQITENNELKLVIPKNYSIGYLYRCLLSESKEFIILEKIFLSETYTVDELADELYISSSSLRRSIKHMNSVLKEIEIEIKLNPLRIRGNEANITNFYIHFLSEKYPLDKPVFNTKQLEVVGDLVSYLANKNKVILDYFIKERLKIVLLVRLTRLNTDYIPKKWVQLDTNINVSIPDVSTIKKKLENSFHIVYTDQLLSHLLSIFLNGNYSFSYKQLKHSASINPKVATTLKKFETLMNLIMNEFQIKLSDSEREKVAVTLCNMVMLQFGKPFILYDYISEMVEYFSTDHFEGIYFIKNTIKELFKSEGIEQYEVNNYIYALIPHFKKYFSKMERQTRPLNIGIIYDTDREHIKLIEEEIHYRFKDKYTTTIIESLHEINQILTQEKHYDVIITNFSELSIPEIAVFCFPIYPKEKDWSELLDYYSHAKYLSNDKTNRKRDK